MTTSDKMELQYVFSALSMLGIIKKEYLNDTPLCDRLSQTFVDITRIADEKLPKKNHNNTSSMLFNAFVEDKYIPHMHKHNNFGMKDFYADSGGLQMVTTGHKITPELKKQIYKVQACDSNYAMCFDVISLDRVTKVRTLNERTATWNKVFNSHLHVEAGSATGKNIKEQVQYFRSVNSDARVIVIVQGNRPQDMVDFYRAINDELDEEDYDYIGGMAVADTCMGNKARESIDMLRAAHLISKEAHPNLSNHLHFLGVGSTSRIEPVLHLHEKYLPNIKKISYDSTSASLTFNNGKWFGMKSIGRYFNIQVDKAFKHTYDMFEEITKDMCGRDELKSLLTDETTGSYAMSTLYGKFRSDDPNLTEGQRVLLASFPYMYIRAVANDFVQKVDDIDEVTMKKRPFMLSLKNVETDADMEHWLSHNRHQLASSRIKRADEDNLEDLFV